MIRHIMQEKISGEYFNKASGRKINVSNTK
jgi:hypothetical protein